MGKSYRVIAGTHQNQPRFYWRFSSMVMKDATPLTPPSAWAELYFQMYTANNLWSQKIRRFYQFLSWSRHVPSSKEIPWYCTSRKKISTSKHAFQQRQKAYALCMWINCEVIFKLHQWCDLLYWCVSHTDIVSIFLNVKSHVRVNDSQDVCYFISELIIFNLHIRHLHKWFI